MNVSEGRGQSEGLEEGAGWVGQVGAQKRGDWSDEGWEDHDFEKPAAGRVWSYNLRFVTSERTSYALTRWAMSVYSYEVLK